MSRVTDDVARLRLHQKNEAHFASAYAASRAAAWRSCFGISAAAPCQRLRLADAAESPRHDFARTLRGSTRAHADTRTTNRSFNGLFGWQLPVPELSEADYFGMHNPSTHIPMGFVRGEGSLLGPRLYFRVRDLGEMCERVVSLGGVIVSRDGYESGSNAVCRDDQGFEFDLWQPAPGY